MIPANLRAKAGDKILEKFRALVSYIDAQKVLSVDSRVLINETGNGTNIPLLPQIGSASFTYPLKITLLSDKEYQVSEGYVNNELPKIKTKNKPKLQGILTDEKNRGIIEKNQDSSGALSMWLFCVVFLQDEGADGTTSFTAIYIDCLNYDEMLKQGINLPELVLGGSHAPREIDNLKGKREFYVPLAFMRADRILHQFTMHNVYLRPYNVGTQKRVSFWPA
jgi:hypothetical protein